MNFCQILDSKQKALEINLDNNIYGTFAEIGAGQEVASFFFKAGGAAGTMAKAMSAYDMTMSDIIYGKSGRYVSEERLHKMIDREFRLLIDRLSKVRPKSTSYFSFANTVAAKSYSGKGECHGWVGIKFQHRPDAEASSVICHVRMLDRENIQQQDAIGIFGVNLIHSCYNRLEDSTQFISSLLENLTNDRIEVDMLRVDGPAFKKMDSRLLCLDLVRRGNCRAVLFDEKGEVQLAKDILYKKNLLVLRGSFRPPTLLNLDMLRTGKELLCKRIVPEERGNIMAIAEVSMSSIVERGGQVESSDFLARVDLLTGLDEQVLITNLSNYYKLSQYLNSCTSGHVGFVMGAYTFEKFFDSQNYADTPDGHLGGLGLFFNNKTSLYVYPSTSDEDKKKLVTIDEVKMGDEDIHLLIYLLETGLVEQIENYDESAVGIWSRTVLKLINEQNPKWEDMVPSSVARQVKKKKLFR